MPDHHHGPPWGHDGPGPPGAYVFRWVIGVVLFLFVFGPFLGFLFSGGFGAVRGPRRLVVLGIALLVLVGIVLFARNRFGRSWRPIGLLIDATRRLGDGETGVRIPITEPGPLAAVSGSFNRMAARLEEEDERRRRLLADLEPGVVGIAPHVDDVCARVTIVAGHRQDGCPVEAWCMVDLSDDLDVVLAIIAGDRLAEMIWQIAKVLGSAFDRHGCALLNWLQIAATIARQHNPFHARRDAQMPGDPLRREEGGDRDVEHRHVVLKAGPWRQLG